MKKRKTPDLEKYLEGKKRRFVNYTQGAKIYKMSYWPFVRLAKKAEANYPIRKTAIVDLNILDDFLEGNPEVVSELKKKGGSVMGNNRSKVPDLEKLVKGGRKKFVRYEEGAMLYSMGVHTFQQLAKDARAVYHVKRIVLVNLDLIDEYLEAFRDEEF